jgi:hypothetical protein
VVFFHVFWGSKNLIFDLIWKQSQNIVLYHFGKVFKIRIQKKYLQKNREKCKGCQNTNEKICFCLKSGIPKNLFVHSFIFVSFALLCVNKVEVLFWFKKNPKLSLKKSEIGGCKIFFFWKKLKSIHPKLWIWTNENCEKKLAKSKGILVFFYF